jgi:hypothetical protein
LLKDKRGICYCSLLSFLGVVEELQIESKYWKAALLHLDDKNPAKNGALFLKKATLFSEDKEISLAAEQLATFFLKAVEKAKGRAKEENFQQALNLVKAYKLTSDTLIEAIGTTLLPLNNKTLSRVTHSTLKELQAPFPQLMPVFKAAATFNPEICAEYLDPPEGILDQFKDKETKIEFAQLLLSGYLHLLTQKNADPLKIHDAYLSIDGQVQENGPLSFPQFMELNFKFLQKFCPHLDASIALLFWKRLAFTTAYEQNGDQIKEWIQIIVKTTIFCADHQLFTDEIHDYYKKVAIDLAANRVNLSNLPYLLEMSIEHKSNFLFQIAEMALFKILRMKEAVKEDKSYQLCKQALKKFILCAIDCKKHYSCFASSNIFTQKEILEFHGRAAYTYFNDPQTVNDEEKLRSALAVYRLTFESPHECTTYQKNNLEQALYHLIHHYLISANGSTKSYYPALRELTKPLFALANNTGPFYDFLNEIGIFKSLPIYLYPLLEKPTGMAEKLEVEKNVLQKKLFNFLLQETESISKIILSIKESLLTDEIQEVVLDSFFNILFLLFVYPEMKSQLISATLNFCYATTRLKNEHRINANAYAGILIIELTKSKFHLETKEMHEALFQLFAFNHADLSWFDKLQFEPSYKAEMILNMLEAIGASCSERSFVVAYSYLKKYDAILREGLGNAEINEFHVAFLLEFHKLFLKGDMLAYEYLDSRIKEMEEAAFPIDPL